MIQLQTVDQLHQMLECKVDQEERGSQDDGGDHDEESGALQLCPSRPSHLLGELDVRFFTIVNELSHLFF